MLSSLNRLRKITGVVARHGLDHYLDKRREKPEGDLDEEDEGVPASAIRFRAILEELGPTFIKFGQVLSTRSDLLPPGFAQGLRGLQDHCPSMPHKQARAAIEKGLGKPIEELFREFDDEPIASASIAQVHRAVTLGGDEVAIKVQRPNVRESIVEDLDLLRYLAQIIEAIVQESGVVTPAGIVEEFEAAFLQELDFEREARMMRRFADNAEADARDYVVPKVYDNLSCATVLTMEFVRGRRLADIRTHEDKAKLAASIVRASFQQVFLDGLFHADPHPGNFFILEDGRVALLDFGSVGQISYAMRETLVVLVVAVGLRDADTVARLLYRVGVPNERILLHELRDSVASLFDEYLRDKASLKNIEATRLLGELFDLAARYQIRVPSEYALIARASATVEGMIRELDPDLEVLATAKPYIRRLVEEQFSLPEFGDSALKNLLRAKGALREAPVAISQILMDLEAGKFQVQVDTPKFDTIIKSIDALGITIFMGFMAGGFITGAFFVLSRYEAWVAGAPAAAVIALFLASILFGTALGRYWLAPRVRKVSLARMRERWKKRR